MKPSPFSYVAPDSLDDALRQLAEFGSESKVLAGGQSLIPLMNFRLVAPQYLIDINGVASLAGIGEDHGLLTIGALTRHRQLERDPVIARRAPVLPKAAAYIGHPQIRTRGTVGGSLAHADPSAELPAAMVALDATMVVSSVRGTRRVEAEKFFTFHLSTDLAEDELLVAVEIPVRQRQQRSAFLEVAARRGDFAAAGVAAVLHMEGDTVAEARLVCSSVGPTPIRVRQAEDVLRGAVVSPAVLAEVATAVADTVNPSGEVRVSAQYKRRTVATLAKRAVAIASSEKVGAPV